MPKAPTRTMTGKRPTNPFKSYQEKVVAERKQVVVRYLSSLRKTRAKFEYVTDLAKAVAEQIALTEGAPCSFTTLLRNKHYKALLLNFMAVQSGAREIQVSDPAAQALIHTVELELGNTKRDNDRLRAYISELEGNRSEHSVPKSASTQCPAGVDDLFRLSNENALICKALWLVLEHFKDLVRIDDRGCIIDLAAPQRNNVIVKAEIAAAFLDWAETNKSIGN